MKNLQNYKTVRDIVTKFKMTSCHIQYKKDRVTGKIKKKPVYLGKGELQSFPTFEAAITAASELSQTEPSVFLKKTDTLLVPVVIDIDTTDPETHQHFLNQFPKGYAEYSISGNLHIWIVVDKYSLPVLTRDSTFFDGKVEVFYDKRCMMVTGDVVKGRESSLDLLIDSCAEASEALMKFEPLYTCSPTVDEPLPNSNQKTGHVKDLTVLDKLLSIIDATQYERYSDWLRMLFAIYEWAGIEGVTSATTFCMRMSNYNGRELLEKWYIEMPKASGRVTGRTILWEANKVNPHYVGSLGSYEGHGFFDASQARDPVDDLNVKYVRIRIGGEMRALFRRYDHVQNGWGIATMRKLELFDRYNRSQDMVPVTFKNGKTKYVSKAELWWKSDKTEIVDDGLVFDPDLPKQQIVKLPTGAVVYNTWGGFPLIRAKTYDENAIAMWVTHLTTHICAGNQDHAAVILDFLAHMLQNPKEKPKFAILLKSEEGVGKGIFIAPFRRILGELYGHFTDPEAIVGEYNGQLESKILAYFDEIYIKNASKSNKIKGLITEDTLHIRKMRTDPYPAQNILRIIMASNYRNPVPLSPTDRRYFVVEGKPIADRRAHLQECKKKQKVFSSQQFATDLYAYLLLRDITNFEPYGPPTTLAKLEQQKSNLLVEACFVIDLFLGRDSFSSNDLCSDPDGWRTSISKRELHDFCSLRQLRPTVVMEWLKRAGLKSGTRKKVRGVYTCTYMMPPQDVGLKRLSAHFNTEVDNFEQLDFNV